MFVDAQKRPGAEGVGSWVGTQREKEGTMSAPLISDSRPVSLESRRPGAGGGVREPGGTRFRELSAVVRAVRMEARPVGLSAGPGQAPRVGGGRQGAAEDPGGLGQGRW